MRTHRGFTLMELMVVTAIIGVLAVVVIPAVMRYIRRSRTIEATLNLRKLYDATVSYYLTEHTDSDGRIVARQFPSAQGFTPLLGACCAQVGQKCAPQGDPAFSLPTWQALNFSIDDPFYYSYQTSGAGGATPGDRYDLDASGDLNCDGVYSLFRRGVTVDVGFALAGGSGFYVVNELE